MNRERLLFAGVLGIFALWFFVMREPPNTRDTAPPGTASPDVLDVLSSSLKQWPTEYKKPGAFTLLTNERPHPRANLPMTAPRGLPNLRPPTSISVALWKYGVLRGPAAKPVEGGAVIALPELAAAAGYNGAGANRDPRGDSWTTFGNPARKKGQVKGIYQNGAWLRPAAAIPAPPAVPAFEMYLCLLETDPIRAQQEGVTKVEVAFAAGGAQPLPFPSNVQSFTIADSGGDLGYWVGAKKKVVLPKQGWQPAQAAGDQLLNLALRTKNDVNMLRWARWFFQETEKRAPKGAQAKKDAILKQLEVAALLQELEVVLSLAFNYLAENERGGDAVFRVIGDLFASRSYGLSGLAERCYALAGSSDAQKSRIEVLLTMGRFDEAANIIQERLAGEGPAVELLDARVRLARGTPESIRVAQQLAGMHTGKEFAAEANRILGGAAYALGDAAGAEQKFLAAVLADPNDSEAYSDLGLALAVQGKAADALACFDRAYKIDSIDNAVMPFLGQAYLKLSAAGREPREKDFEEDKAYDAALKAFTAALGEAAVILDKLREDNPKDLLVQYYQGYLKEVRGDLAEAAKIYRHILDENYHYRFVIARLGLVQSRRVLQGEGDKLAREAVAHLKKAAALNPNDAVLRYGLARFVTRDLDTDQDRFARLLLDEAAKLPAPAGDAELPLWIQSAKARLVYRNAANDIALARGEFEEVFQLVKRDPRYRGKVKEAEKDPVYLFAEQCLEIIDETEMKVILDWDFPQKPREWNVNKSEAMQISFVGGRAKFHGQVKMERGFKKVLDFSSFKYDDKLTGKTFFKVEVEGECKLKTASTSVEIGVGLVLDRKSGPTGIQIKADMREKCPAIRLEGGESETFKQIKSSEYVPFREVKWPEDGKFKIEIEVVDRDKGYATVRLNGTNLFEAAGIVDSTTKEPMTSERCSVLGKRGRGAGRPLRLVIWVEGRNGATYNDVFLEKVTLTRAKRN